MNYRRVVAAVMADLKKEIIANRMLFWFGQRNFYTDDRVTLCGVIFICSLLDNLQRSLFSAGCDGSSIIK